jgi:hypothetical protein
MPNTTYFDQKIWGLAIGQVGYTIPPTFYVGLSSTPPSQVQAGTPVWNFNEPAGNAYARVAVPNDSVHWGPIGTQPPTGWTIQNKLIVTYLQSSGPWLAGANLAFFGLFDSLLAGNLLLFGGCSPAQAVGAANITLSFAASALTATIN